MRSPWKPGPERGACICSLTFSAGGPGPSPLYKFGALAAREMGLTPHSGGCVGLPARSEMFPAWLGWGWGTAEDDLWGDQGEQVFGFGRATRV